MNVKLNQKIMELTEVDDMFVFPSCGDESNVFGALYHAYYEDTSQLPSPMTTLTLGGEYHDDAISKILEKYPFKHCQVHTRYSDSIDSDVAHLLAQNHVVARVSGKMEFGARALGNRSLLANPADPNAVTKINKMIKSRDFWMPFAPAMIDPTLYIKNPKNISAPYMIMAFNSHSDKHPVMRAVIHPYDGSCRPQIVHPDQAPSFHSLLSTFKTLTGEGIILNTSLNLHGYPMAYTPEDALYILDHSGLTHLALGNYMVTKT